MKLGRLFKGGLLLAALMMTASCATLPDREAKLPVAIEGTATVADQTAGQAEPLVRDRDVLKRQPPPAPPASSIGYMVATEDLSPLKTRIMSVSARNTPLRDVLYTIADTTGLNLVMDKGVNPDAPVTITLKDMKAEDVLSTLLSSVDYFYEVRDNVLIVKLMETRIFEFGQPSVIQEYSVEVGGDMLGSARTGTAGVTGSITQKISSDTDAFKFWDSIEKSIGNLLGASAGAVGDRASVGLEPAFSVNRMTGTIVVTASKKDLERVHVYILQLKKIMKRQVFVEARIIEVQLTDRLQYGVDWTFLSGEWEGGGQASMGTTKFTDALTGLANFNITLTGGDFSSLLRALQTQGNINVLSNPRVNIMNGQTAFLSVGRKTDFISKVETTSTGLTTSSVPEVTFTVETSSVLSGIIFGIVPYISEGADEKISLTISPIISDLVKFDTKTIGLSGSNTVELSLPTIDLRELSTTVRVRDGDMVIIGGLIQNKDSVKDNNVPFLSDIPLFGNLFKSRDMSTEKTELIILLKPVIITET